MWEARRNDEIIEKMNAVGKEGLGELENVQHRTFRPAQERIDDSSKYHLTCVNDKSDYFLDIKEKTLLFVAMQYF